MNRVSMHLCSFLLATGFSAGAIAQERPDHFRGKDSATLAEAVANFSEYNKQLASLVAKSDLAPADMVKVHELTYTLENALEKLRQELEQLAGTLEEVHVASEKLDAAVIKSRGRVYLETARKVIP